MIWFVCLLMLALLGIVTVSLMRAIDYARDDDSTGTKVMLTISAICTFALCLVYTILVRL